MRSVKERASWLTTSPRWSCLRGRPTALRAPPAAPEALPSPLTPGSEGAHASTRATVTATTTVKASTGRSMPISPVRTVNRLAYSTRRSSPKTCPWISPSARAPLPPPGY